MCLLTMEKIKLLNTRFKEGTHLGKTWCMVSDSYETTAILRLKYLLKVKKISSCYLS